MKKFLLTIFTVLLALSLIACSKDADEETETKKKTKKDKKQVEETVEVEVTPEATLEPTEEPTTAPVEETPASDAFSSDAKESTETETVVTPEITPEPIIVNSPVAVDELQGTWLVDIDALFDYVVQVTYDELEGEMSLEDVREYCLANKDEIMEMLGDVSKVSMTFSDSTVYLADGDDITTCTYELSENGVILYEGDATDSLEFFYDEYTHTLSATDESTGIVVAFYRDTEDRAGNSVTSGDDDNNYTGSYYGLESDTITSVAEIVGEWHIDAEILYNYYKEMLETEYGDVFTSAEIDELLADTFSLESLTELYNSFSLIISEDVSYLSYEDESMECYVVLKDGKIYLTNPDYPDEDVELIYSAELNTIFFVEESEDLYIAFTRKN